MRSHGRDVTTKEYVFYEVDKTIKQVCSICCIRLIIVESVKFPGFENVYNWVLNKIMIKSTVSTKVTINIPAL